MRFCPFCSAETSDELAVCQACGRRLPPLPPRRRNAPPTGVQLPPRATAGMSAPLPRRTGTTIPPPLPMPHGPPPDPSHVTPANAGAQVSPGPRPAHSNPALNTTVVGIGPDPESRRALLSALTPGPAAQRRDAPLPEPRDADQSARRRSDVTASPPGAPPPPTAPPPPIASMVLMPAPSQSGSIPIPRIAPHGDAHRLAPPPPASGPIAPHGDAHPPGTPSPLSGPTVAPLSGPTPSAIPLLQPHVQTAPMPAPTFEPSPPSRPSRPSAALIIAATGSHRSGSGITPPPTRTTRPGELADRPFTPPAVSPVPEIPEPGLVHAAKYALRFGRARYQRRGAIKTLGSEIKQDTDALDQVLGALGKVARNVGASGRVFSAENSAITDAETRIASLTVELGEVEARKTDEKSRFVDVERERNLKLGDAERLLGEAQADLASFEGQRRSMRDSRKSFERRQKAYLKSAEDNEREAGSSQLGDTRAELRRSAEQNRKEAAAIEPERQECDRKLASLERPIGEATARLDAAKAELDAAKRSLADAREGHTHRLAELDAEQKRKAREIGLAEGEISRRLVTLGTLINLNRIEDPQLDELYQRIDRIRGAITARTTEIEKLTAEREAYDRGILVRGIAAMGGAVILFLALIVILRAIL